MKTILLIPTYNERENLPKIIEAIEKHIKTDFLIIDDNSPDGTGQLAEQLAKTNPAIKILHRTKKEGLGRAYVAGYSWAIENNYEIVIQMDCDFSHDPSYLPKMLEEIKTNDLVIGSRYCSGISCYNWPLQRILLSYFANRFVKSFSGLPVNDATGGFKCYHIEVLKKINVKTIETTGYGFQVEITYRAFKLGFKIKEIPIIFYERTVGASKMSKTIVFEAFWLVLKIWLRLYRFKATKN